MRVAIYTMDAYRSVSVGQVWIRIKIHLTLDINA